MGKAWQVVDEIACCIYFLLFLHNRLRNKDNYSVFYIINEDKVIVTDVLYSASDIEERLKGV